MAVNTYRRYVSAASHAPVKNWRVNPLAVMDSSNNTTLEAYLLAGGGTGTNGHMAIADGATRTLAIKVPAGGPYVWSFVEVDAGDFTATTAMSYDSVTGATDSGTWTDAAALTLWHVPTTSGHNAANGQKVDIAYDAEPRWVNIVFTAGGDSGDGLTLKNFRLHRIDTEHKRDYWLVIGASISERHSSPYLVYDEVVAAHPDYDPLVFNRAQESLRSDQILPMVPGILAEHPYASYVIIHCIGNNVSSYRTATGPSETDLNNVIDDVTNICNLVRAAGMIPILGSASFRDYHTDATKMVRQGRMPHAGAWGFNEGIAATRAALSPEVPEFDPYTFSRLRPTVLSADGVHWQWPGGWAQWRKMLVGHVFSKIYTGTASLQEELPNHAVINLSNTERTTKCYNRVGSALNSAISVLSVEGKATGWTFTITKAASGHGDGLGAITGNNSGAFLDTILNDYQYVDAGTPTATYVLSGLDVSKRYNIRLHGGRNTVAADRVSLYTVTGGIIGSAAWTETKTLDAAGNTSTTADFDYVPPTNDGKITIGLAINSGSIYGYLGVVEVIEV